MDGFQFRIEQQKDPELAKIPVVVMTADSNVESKCLDMGVQGYLKKPVHISSVLDTLEKYRPKNLSVQPT
jgi:two-component system chemotaxis response regulator CheY